MPTPIAGDRPIRWGILGAGGIADTVSHDINLSAGNVVTAVAARDAERAARFAARHGAARSYGDYRALVDDGEVDVVYIATTHPHHKAQALMAIEAGKAVLIEKPVCLNAADAAGGLRCRDARRSVRNGGDVDSRQPADPQGAAVHRRR